MARYKTKKRPGSAVQTRAEDDYPLLAAAKSRACAADRISA
jgi:hypothetical protein